MNHHIAITGKLNLPSLIGFLFLFLWFPNLVASQVLTVPETNLKSRMVVSPYAQAVPNDSYTFISVSHPSLDTAQDQIGVGLEVIGMTTLVNNAAGRAAIFTVDAGETHRVFVANVSHATINSTLADSKTHLIFTVDSAQFGSIRAVGINENPASSTVVNGVRKFNNLSQLNFWGVVYIESSGTGFAMEFLGDAHDSTVGRNFGPSNLEGIARQSTGVARGIN